jgi:hypothetical protein
MVWELGSTAATTIFYNDQYFQMSNLGSSCSFSSCTSCTSSDNNVICYWCPSDNKCFASTTGSSSSTSCSSSSSKVYFPSKCSDGTDTTSKSSSSATVITSFAFVLSFVWAIYYYYRKRQAAQAAAASTIHVPSGLSPPITQAPVGTVSYGAEQAGRIGNPIPTANQTPATQYGMSGIVASSAPPPPGSDGDPYNVYNNAAITAPYHQEEHDNSQGSTTDELLKLHELLQKGILNQWEYDNAKQKILQTGWK